MTKTGVLSPKNSLILSAHLDGLEQYGKYT
jgi:hypothetical protein